MRLSDLSPVELDRVKFEEFKSRIADKRKKAAETRQFQKDKAEFEEKFYRLMFELNFYNKFNKTYYLKILYRTNYGFFAEIYLEPGLSFQTLNDKKGILQENLNCIWIMTSEQLKDFAAVKIVTIEMDLDIPYAPPEHIKPFEMYLGMDFSQNIILNDCNEYCMFLLGGTVGSGKTRFMYQMLLTWILKCSPAEVEIYLGDVAKNEYIMFKDVKHVRTYAADLKELLNMMLQVERKIDERNAMISALREKNIATNIEEYNRVQKTPLPYIYVVIDEFSVVVMDKSDSKEEKEAKQRILDILKKTSKIGRSLGAFVFLALQKCSRDEMGLPILKNVCSVRISFRANDLASSEVIMGDNSAVGLRNRYAVYSQNGGEHQEYMFSPGITIDYIKDALTPYIRNKAVKVTSLKREPKVSIVTKLLPVQPLREIPKGDDKVDY